MKRALIAACLFAIAICLCAIALLSDSPRTEESAPSPFESVLVRHDAILATFPAVGIRWHIESGSSPRRISEYGEALTLQAGASLRLSERHSAYSFTVQLKPTPGLHVKSTFDGRSVGGSVTNQSYFIPAR